MTARTRAQVARSIRRLSNVLDLGSQADCRILHYELPFVREFMDFFNEPFTIDEDMTGPGCSSLSYAFDPLGQLVQVVNDSRSLRDVPAVDTHVGSYVGTGFFPRFAFDPHSITCSRC